ncbi:hypothetical protein PENTCL1PPCAC_22083, partial [Pristionchus entomophagus]
SSRNLVLCDSIRESKIQSERRSFHVKERAVRFRWSLQKERSFVRPTKLRNFMMNWKWEKYLEICFLFSRADN